jgi:hypothetical protein
MKPSLSPIASRSLGNASPEAPGAKPRLSPHAPSVGSKRPAASAELDALSPRPSSACAATQASSEPAQKRPRLAIDELTRRAARPAPQNAPASPADAVHSTASSGIPIEASEPRPPSRHFDAHASHQLHDIIHRLNTLHHDYGEHLTPEAVAQLKHEIAQLHEVAKKVLDIKRRLMRRMK